MTNKEIHCAIEKIVSKRGNSLIITFDKEDRKILGINENNIITIQIIEVKSGNHKKA